MSEFLLFAFLALVLVTVVGHGLWMLVATIFRAISDQSGEYAATPSPTARACQDLIGTNRQIEQMLAAGAISQDVYDLLRENLENYAQRLGVTLPPRSRDVSSDAPVHARDQEADRWPATRVDESPTPKDGGDAAPVDAELVDAAPPADARDSIHPLDRSYPETPPPAGQQRSRALADVLQSFLDQRNIRWGELISGILIVGSAVGLVVSLRFELSQAIPYFPAVLFLGITAAIHGAGMYTLHRWKLPSTSRGLLLIAMLLIPLNATAACIFTERGEAAAGIDAQFLIAVALGALAWGAIAWQAARALAPGHVTAWMLAVMGSTLAQPFINRIGVGTPTLTQHLILMAVPAGSLLAAGSLFATTMRQALDREGRRTLSNVDCDRLLMLLGVGLFSFVTAAVLAVVRAESLTHTLGQLAIPASLVAAVVLAAGVTLRGKTADELPPAYRIAGVSLAILAGMWMVGSLGFTWPDPTRLIAVSATNAVALVLLAMVAQLAWLDPAVAFFVGTGSVVAVHDRLGNLSLPPADGVAGRTDWLAAVDIYRMALLDGVTSLTLAVIALVVAGVAGLLSMGGERPRLAAFRRGTHAGETWGAALALAGTAWLLAIRAGFVAPRPDEVWIAFGVFIAVAAGLVTAGLAGRSTVLTGLGGAALLLPFILATVPANVISERFLADVDVQRRWMAALLGHAATLTMLGSVTSCWRGERKWPEPEEVSPEQSLLMSAAAVALAAAPLVVWLDPGEPIATRMMLSHAAGGAVIAAAWLVSGWRLCLVPLMLTGQAVAACALALCVAAGLLQLPVLVPDLDLGWWQAWPQATHFSLALASLFLSAMAVMAVRVSGTPRGPLRLWADPAAEAAYWLPAALAGVLMIAVFSWTTDWAPATTLLLIAAATVLAAFRQRRVHLELAGGLAVVLVVVGANYLPAWLGRPRQARIHAVVAAPLFYGWLWLLAAVARERWHEHDALSAVDPRRVTPMYCRVVTALAVVYIGFVTALETLAALVDGANPIGQGEILQTPAGWILLGLVALVVFTRLWDRTRPMSLGQPYLLGLAVTVLAVTATGLRPEPFAATLLLAIGLFVMAAGGLWRRRVGVNELARQLETRDLQPSFVAAEAWLPGVQAALALLATAGALLFVLLSDDRTLRYLAAFTPLLGAAGVAALADASQRLDSGRTRRQLTIVLLVTGAVYFGWADLEPSGRAAQWLIYGVRMMISLSLSTLALGLLAPRVVRASSWRAALPSSTAGAAAATLLALLAVLGLELLTFVPGDGTPLTTVQAAAVGVVLAALFAGLLLIAVRPERDPLSLSLEGRMTYVYAAETVVGLGLLHLYLTMPWIFDLPWRVYWPYLTMAAAFLGAGGAQLLERRGLNVLSEPLGRSFSLLPVAPVVGMWLAASAADYDVVLFLGGLFYLVLGMTRGSQTMGLIAAALGNAALLAFYGRFDGFHFVDHPQLWLIPPAISTLAAIHWHRHSLDEPTATFARYVCVAVIYLSSTSEILLTGLGRQLWPPMVLALLSVAGVMAGIMLRVRSFLYFGTAFVFVALLGMVSHAHQAIDHTWPWWAFGISLGVLVLTFFGFFEKKRAEIEDLIRRLREWES